MQARYGRLGWPLALTGAVLLAAGTFLSWSYVATILGNLSVYAYPGEVQLFALVLALIAVAFLLMYRGPLHKLGDWFKSALAVRTLGIGAAVYMTVVLLLIAVQSGGLINIDPGGWVSWVGSLLLAAGGLLLKIRAINDPIKARLPGWVEILVIVILLALALFGAAFALGQEDGSVFLLFFLALGTAIWRWRPVGSSRGSASSPPGTDGSSCSGRSSWRSSSPSRRAGPTRTCRSPPRSSSSRSPRWG